MSVEFNARIWRKDPGRIAIASPEAGFISTVSNDPKSKRYHPNLYKKLDKILNDREVSRNEKRDSGCLSGDTDASQHYNQLRE